jgi:DNA-binding NtrC family response regulator/pSer/pThr/pTyr-binding forkhead associated (FHA) protein
MDDKPDKPESKETAALSEDILEQIRANRKQESGTSRRVSLLIYSSDGVQVVQLSEGQSLVVGRAPPADVTIRDSSLSRQHASIELKDGEVFVEDLQSTNGTRINGEKIESGKAEAGSEIVFGAVTASVHMMKPKEVRQLGLESHDRFLAELEAEINRAGAFKRSLALIMLRAAQHKQSHVSRWFPNIRKRLRHFDRLGLYSPDSVEILLPETSSEEAQELAAAVAGGQESLLCGLAVYPATDSPVVRAAPPRQKSEEAAGPVVRSPAMQKIFSTLSKLSFSAIPVLITGETGTGKEVVARAIHEGGKRKDHPMIAVNCGGIPSQLVESTLFGHEKGAFTGATGQAKGVFESASGGTVLLDEVGELPASAQAALLRVLESKKFSRVGSQKEIEVDVRVLAATHRDLEEMAKTGDFREDLLYRLNAMTLQVPPLRERLEDIEPLILHFTEQANKINECSVWGIDEDAMQMLVTYTWPGNVRELRNAIERAVVIAQGDRISTEDLPERVRDTEPTTQVTQVETEPAPEGEINLKSEMQRHEADLILKALRQSDWDRKKAAALLGLPIRTLAHKMQAHGIRKTSYEKPD